MAILLEGPPPLFLLYQRNLTMVILITSSSSSKYTSMASLPHAEPVGGYEVVEPPPGAFQVCCAICYLKLRDPHQQHL